MLNNTILQSQSAAANFTSGVTDLCDLTTYSIQVAFSAGAGDLVGTLKLQASLDNSTWVDISGSSVAVTASANNVWDVTRAGYRYVRVVWTYTSGTGNVVVTIHIKGPIVAFN